MRSTLEGMNLEVCPRLAYYPFAGVADSSDSRTQRKEPEGS